MILDELNAKLGKKPSAPYFDWVGHAIDLGRLANLQLLLARDATSGRWHAHIPPNSEGGRSLAPDPNGQIWLPLATLKEADAFQVALELDRMDMEAPNEARAQGELDRLLAL